MARSTPDGGSQRLGSTAPRLAAVGRPRHPAGGADISPQLLVAAGTALLGACVALNGLYIVTLQPSLAPVLGVACVAGAAVLLRPAWLVPLVLGVTYMSIGASHFGGLPSPTEVGALILLVFAARQAILHPPHARDVALIAALFLLPQAASMLLSGGGVESTVNDLQRLSFLAIAALCLRGVEDVERMVKVIVGLGVILGVGAAWSVLVGPTALFPLDTDTEFGTQAPRAAGPFGEPNFFALSLAVITPFALLLVTRGGWQRWLGSVSAICVIAGVMAAGSRAGLLTVFVVLLGAALVSGRRMRVPALAATAVLVVLVPVFASQTTGSAERRVDGRATENLIAIAMFRDHPIAGVGPGQYTVLYRDYARDIGNDPRSLRFAHSLPLEIAAEQGIFGLLGWLAVGAFMVRFVVVRRLWRSPLGAALLLSIVAYLFDSLFLHGSQLRILHILLGILLAFGWSWSEAPARAPLQTPSPR